MRQTSEVTDTTFPFADDNVAFILVHNQAEIADDTERGFSHASTQEKKYALLNLARECDSEGEYGQDIGSCSLLAVWPGATRSDVFFVDDLEQAAQAFG